MSTFKDSFSTMTLRIGFLVFQLPGNPQPTTRIRLDDNFLSRRRSGRALKLFATYRSQYGRKAVLGSICLMDVDIGEIAKQWYEKNEPEGALSATILRCFFAGHIIKRPDFLTSWRNLLLGWSECHVVPRENANGWYFFFWASTNKFRSSYELCYEISLPDGMGVFQTSRTN